MQLRGPSGLFPVQKKTLSAAVPSVFFFCQRCFAPTIASSWTYNIRKFDEPTGAVLMGIRRRLSSAHIYADGLFPCADGLRTSVYVLELCEVTGQ
jgi:hypothetical protein